MRPAEFDFERPRTVAEVCARLARGGADCAVLAGGQSLLKQLRERIRAPRALIDISALRELAYVRGSASEGIDIGALTTLATLATDATIARHCPALAAGAARVGDVQIRARGTLGGNLLSGWSSNLGVVLAALGASATLVSSTHTRAVDAEELVRAGCASDELVVGFRLPRTPASAFEKLARRSANPVIASAAVGIRERRFGLAVGGVHDHPLRLPAVEALLDGGERRRPRLADAIGQAVSRLDAPTTPHASAAYRRRVLPVIALRALERALAGAGIEGLA